MTAHELPHLARALQDMGRQLREERERRERAEAERDAAAMEVGTLLMERSRADRRADALWKALDGARAACATVMVAREYDEALRWRRQFLGLDEYEDDGPDLEISPLAAQLVCYLVADCMSLREVDAALRRAGEGV